MQVVLGILWVFSLVLCVSHAQPVPLSKRYFDYSDFVARGVNIGGWLVLEPYITPSLFEVFRTNEDNDDGIPVDEYHYCKYLGVDLARDRLVEHWSSFYKEEDFVNIADAGFNLVRIPIGYWAFETLDSDPYVSGLQEAYLDLAISWASNNNLKVWVDLHGAAGSQNGFDNSGLRDELKFQESENIEVTKSVLMYLLEKYSGSDYSDTVIGVELLNEPLGPSIDMSELKTFNTWAYDYLRNTECKDQIVVIHDAFQAFNYWDDFMTLDDGYYGIVLDHHHYQVFSSGELSRSIDEHIQVACDWGTSAKSEYHWTVAGEWSAALTDCAKWLNGVGIGARYDGTYYKDGTGSSYVGSCDGINDFSSWSQTLKDNYRKYIEAQLDAFELNGGWIFWCYKTESTIDWDFQRLAYHNLFPQPLDDRQYPNQCNY